MSFRFKRRIRLFPGVYFNIGKTGVSMTIGPRGANINIGKGGTYLNTGIPGTGLSWREKLSGSPTPNQPIAQPPNVYPETSGIPPVTQPLTITPALPVSSTSEIVTSEGLIGLSEQISDMRMHREKVYAEFENINTEITTLNENIKIFKNQFFPNKEKIEKSRERISLLTKTIVELSSSLSHYRSELVFDLDKSIENQYKKVVSCFKDLMNCQNIWDITSDRDENNSNEAKSNAGMIVERSLVKFNLEKIEDVFSKYDQLHLQNANGADLYFFPACILLKNHKNDLILVDLKDLKFEQQIQRFIESSETVPSDAEIVDYVWTESNKDGTPDLRYKDNIRIPIVHYASLSFLSESGLCESYYVSNLYAAQGFAREFTKYLGMLHGEEAVPESIPVPRTSPPPVQPDSPPAPIISRDYFDLITGVIDDTKTIFRTMQEDSDLLASLKSKMGDSEIEPKVFLLYCVTFDVVRVFCELLGESITERVVERSCLVFIVNSLVNDINHFSNINYEEFNDFVHDEKMAELTKTFLGIGRKDSPFSITIGHGDDDPLMRNTQFAVPTFLMVVESPYFDKYAVVLCRLATVIAKADGTVSGDEEEALKKILNMIRNPVPELSKKAIKVQTVNENQTLEEVIGELDSLVGLESVKQEVRTLVNLAKIQNERSKLKLKSPEMSFHLVLTGSPGTGKTTVARIVSKIYSKLGILKKGQLVETDRSGLIAEYLGQTPAKVNKVIDSALDGVLFIDEAYSLTQGCKEDYGSEAIATLLKRMEDDRKRLVVVVAGYTEEMKIFIDANSGLKSRFNRYIEFPDYNPDEMLLIFDRQCQLLDYRLEDLARIKVLELFKRAYEKRDRSFGNGRYVRNIFEKAMGGQANRIAGLPRLTKDILTTIVVDDIPES